MLVEELGKYASMAMDGVDSSSSLSIPDYAPKKDIYGYIDIMSSVELISIIMGWSWTTEKVLSELRKLLPSSVQGNFSTSLVVVRFEFAIMELITVPEKSLYVYYKRGRVSDDAREEERLKEFDNTDTTYIRVCEKEDTKETQNLFQEELDEVWTEVADYIESLI